jgi:aryl carrier-like protein
LTDVTSCTECSNVGHPFGLNVIYVLDQRLRPVPLGCAGELFIGGPQLARGYLKDPKQTSEVFIDDPFRPGNIMYATGDLARMSPINGSITYLGRRDTQVKIRGFRVETGEIEVVLKAASKFILNAVVLKINVGHDILVAFLEYRSDLSSPSTDLCIIHDETVTPTLSALKRAVLQKLPSYMAPGSYVVLNRFPLTLSRKVDRNALADFFHVHEQEIREHRTDSKLFSEPSSSGSQAPPSNEVQATLRSLWAMILNLSEDSLSIDDDFYMMGGDSISAIRLASAAREAGIHLLATDIIQNPTILAMAHIAKSSAVNHNFDDDDAPSVEFEQMSPSDLTLMELDQQGLDVLRDHLLPKHSLSPRSAQFHSDVSGHSCRLPLAMFSMYIHARHCRQASS